MSHINLNGDIELHEPLPFRPHPFQIARMSNVPRYLFRLVAPTTAGQTTVSEVIPPVSEADIHAQDIFRLELKEAADLLNAHFLWDHGHESKCNFTSWTSSLLSALQYGMFRSVRVELDLDLDNIFLFVVDTSAFPKGTFIKDMEIINVFRKYIDPRLLKWRDGEKYFGEYICQGDLNITGRCATTSIEKLIDNGLFQICPYMEERKEWTRWANRVVDLREPFKHPQDSLHTTHAEVRTAITIAQGCYGDRWAVPIAAMLLALQPRRKRDSVIIEGFQALFSAQEIEALSLGDLAIDGHKLPEVKQFAEIINDIYHQFTGNDINLLIKPFQKHLIIGSG